MPETLSREQLVYMSKLAEQAERYDEMTEVVKEIAQNYEELTVEERNLLSVAFKNSVGGRRASWRIISSIEQKEKGKDLIREKLAADYRKKIEAELLAICRNIIDLLDVHLIKSNQSAESKVFFYKMKGDYWRYISEFTAPAERPEPASEAKLAYEEASTIAHSNLPSTHPIRLGLALNHSVFHYEILNQQMKACDMAHKAFEAAITELDNVADDMYKDSTLIMQLLRDNLTLWSAETQNEQAGTQEGEAGNAMGG